VSFGIHRAIWLVALGNLGISLVWQLYNAYLPIFLQAGRPGFAEGVGVQGYGLGAGMTGFLMTLDNIAALLILPYVGVVSDRLRTRFGRRIPFIAVGAPLAALAFILIPMALGNPLWMLLGIVALFLLSMDIFRTPLIALMPDLTPPAKRSQGNAILIFLYNLGFVLAAVVGGKLFTVSPQAPFLFGGIGLFLTTLLVVLFVREPEPAENSAAEESPSLPALLQNLMTEKEPSLRILLLAIFVCFLGVSALEVFFTSYAVNIFKLDSGEATQLLAFFGMAGLLGAIPAGYLGTRLGRRPCVLFGLGMLAILLTTINFVGSLVVVKVLLVLMGLSWAQVTVNLFPVLLDMGKPNQGGAYSGLFFLANQAASIFGPVLAGVVLDVAGRNYKALFIHIPVMMTIALLLIARVRRGV